MLTRSLRILVIEDEEPISAFIEMGLQDEGYIVLKAFDGLTGLRMARDNGPDLILLDVMLPGLNGYEVCEAIKRQSDVPIIMLSAKSEVDDRIKGLNIGADDYLIKPFSFKELSARIRARLRKIDGISETVLCCGNFEMHEKAHEIYYKNQLLHLSVTEYRLLELLLKNKGSVLSKQLILEKVWGFNFNGEENIVEVYIKYLRRKIQDDDFKVIKTVRGVGYKVMDS